MKKPLLTLALICSFIIGCTYTFNDRSNSKLHCKICDKSYFVVSKRITKFTVENGEPVLRTDNFYKCAHCGFLSDVRVNAK